MRRTASFDVLCVKISLMDSPVGEFKNQRSAVNFEQEGCIFHLYGEHKPLGGLSLIFGGRRPRRNHAIQIWWRSVQGFLVGWGSKFAFSHRLWRSSLQHSHYRVRCEGWAKFAISRWYDVSRAIGGNLWWVQVNKTLDTSGAWRLAPSGEWLRLCFTVF